MTFTHAKWASLIWVAFWAGYALFAPAPLFTLSLNEIGDFFAGAFAPVAFLWLILGYLQQGKELQQNTMALQQQAKSLELQVEELRNSVEQQKVIAESAAKELELIAVQSEQEEKRKRLEAMPIFEYTKEHVVDPSSKELVYSLKFKNTGNLIRYVVFMATGDGPLQNRVVSKNTPSIEYWHRGDCKWISFGVLGGSSLSSDDRLKIEVEYEDGMGEREKQNIYLVAISGTRLKAVPFHEYISQKKFVDA